MPRLNLRGVWHFQQARRVVARLRERGAPNLIYGRHIYSVALAASRFPEVDVGYEAHMLPANLVQKRVEGWLLRRRNFKRLVVISDALKRDYLNAFAGLRPEQVLVAHDGADPVRDAGKGRRRAPPLPGRADAPKACYAGRLIEGKGAGVLTALAPLCPEIDFHVFGGRDSEIEACKRRTAAGNLYFHGHVAHGELMRILPFMDVMLAPLQPSMPLQGRRYDIARWTSPLKIFEYMAAGKPMICSDLPVLREVLEHGRNCLLRPANDVSAWRDALRHLARDPGAAARLGQRARRDFLDRHTWQARARHILAAMKAG